MITTKRGRPKSTPDKTTEQIAMRLAPGLLAAIDEVRQQLSVERFGAAVSRTEAMKTLMFEALRARKAGQATK